MDAIELLLPPLYNELCCVEFMLDHIEHVTLVPSDGTKDSTFCREDLVSLLISSFS